MSIIVATYNVGKLLQKTIESLKSQTYKNFELIVVDGNSSDDTLKYIAENQAFINRYISEPDSGIYDAWNKGLKLANGNWIGFLGAGDEYVPEALERYVRFIVGQPEEIEYVSSRVAVVDEKGRPLLTRGGSWGWPKFLRFMSTAHVGSLHSRILYDRYGEYDVSYDIAGDYEFLMRARGNLKAGYIDFISAKMLIGGASSSSLKCLREEYRLKTETGMASIVKSKILFYVDVFKALIRDNLNKMGVFWTLR